MTRSLLLCSLSTGAALLLGCGPADSDPPFPGDTTPPLLEGAFCVPTGNGFFDATVRVLDEDGGTVAEATTDYEGSFKLEDIPSGLYTVEATRGHHRVETSIDFDAEEGMHFEPVCGEATHGNRVVVEGELDTIESVIGGLGYSYLAVGIQSNEPELDYLTYLRFPSRLSDYDTIFFNSGMDDEWRFYEDDVVENLTNFVAGGGSLYASDRAYWLVELLDPEALDFAGEDSNYNEALVGAGGFYGTTVHSPGLGEAFPDEEAALKLEEGFALIDSVRDDVDVLLEIDLDGDSPVPVAARWVPFEGGGTVVFTSTHNNKQLDSYGWNILFEIVTSL